MEDVKAFADGSGSLTTRDAPETTLARSTSAPTWTPPSPSAAAASSVEPRAILDELVTTVTDVRAVILASIDGFGLAHSSSMPDEPSHPAMLAAAIGLAHQLVTMGGGEQLRQLVVDHDGGLMLVWPIGTQRVLAVLAATTVDQRRVRAFIQAHAVWLAGATT